jgi:hypothetical protein
MALLLPSVVNPFKGSWHVRVSAMPSKAKRVSGDSRISDRAQDKILLQVLILLENDFRNAEGRFLVDNK